jgi:putative aminopeptidase FrvX
MVAAMDTADLLRQLVEARGPSGYEAELRGIASERLGEFADDLRVDALGNLIALKRGEGEGPRPSLMLAGHMDEIGLIVSGIEKGFLRVTRIGGWDPRVLFGQRVTVHGRRELPGMVVSVPPHFTAPSERDKPVSLEKLFVDIGLPPDEVERHVRVGDVITMRARMLRLNGTYAAGKAMDDRAAVAAIVLCLEELARRRHSWDVHAVATAQEETGCIGAGVGAYGIEPTAAVAIDVTFGQQPGTPGPETFKMDGGPSIAIGPNIHPLMFDRLVAAARSVELPYQVEPTPGNSGTDAWSIQIVRSGVPTGLLGIPVRSMHSPVETVSLRDIERTGRLLAEFIARLDDAFAATLVVKDAFAAPPPVTAAPPIAASTAPGVQP